MKAKTRSLYVSIRHLFLAILLCLWLQNQNSKFLCLDKAFVPCSFTWFMAIKFETGVLWNLLTKMGVYLFLFMVLISKREVSITQQDVCSYCFVYRYKIHNRVLITKTALTKLLENTLDESLKLKNMSDERLECLTKSLLSLNLFWTMSDLSKTLILHSGTLSKLRWHMLKVCETSLFNAYITNKQIWKVYILEIRCGHSKTSLC